MKFSYSLSLLIGAQLSSNGGSFAFAPTAFTNQLKLKTQHNVYMGKTRQFSSIKDNEAKNDADIEETPLVQVVQKGMTNVVVAATLFCSTLMTCGGNLNVDSTTSFFPQILQPPAVSAAVAPLADVGLREFLVKDGKQFLRLALPTSLPATDDPVKLGDTARVAQESIELVRLRLEQVGFSGKTAVWNAALKEVNTVKSLLDTPGMLKGIDGKAKQANGQELVEQAKGKIEKLVVAIRGQDITSTLALDEEVGAIIGEIRSLSLTPGKLPYEVPSEYSKLPQLRGRATVTCTISRDPNNKKPFILPDGSKTNAVDMKLVVDGYHAPITGGNFVDLVQRQFYDKMPIQTVGDLIVQTGQPSDKKAEKRTIPLELFYKKDKAPTYGYTSDDDMRATESFVLPFQAYGALGMEYSIDDEEGVNSGTSEFWFLKWDQGLLAPGRNTLDGSHACFGYIVEGQDFIGQMVKGDIIESMKVVEGSENLFL